MTLSNGDKLGPYEILAPIGEGGMGEVYRARDTRLDRTVALKVSKQDFDERFEREARAVASLNHPHICQLFDVGPNYLVMEYIEGAPLKGPLPVAQAVAFGLQILDALAAAHAKKITHRDLKPDNVLVTKRGIKLLDFGLAKQQAPLAATDATLVAAVTSQGQIVGTLQYMAPEQLQGREVDARADLFAFGCVLYEMLTGRRAFLGDNAATVIAAIVNSEPAPDPLAEANVPDAISRVLSRCFAKDPEQRWHSARDLAINLQWASTATAVTTTPASATPPRLWMGIAAACALIACVAIAVALSTRPAVPSVAPSVAFGIDTGEISIGNNPNFRMSPDGRYLALRGSQAGVPRVYLRALDSPRLVPVVGGDGARILAWSPDNRSLLVQSVGGSPARLEVGGSGVPVFLPQLSADTIAWGPEDHFLLARRTGLPTPILLARQRSEPAPVTELATGEDGHRDPFWLPGGQRFLFRGAVRRILAGDVVSHQATPVLDNAVSPAYVPAPGGSGGYLLFLRETTLYAQQLDPKSLKLSGQPAVVAQTVSRYSASDNGGLAYSAVQENDAELRWFERTGASTEVLGPVGAHQEIELSPDGRVAITVFPVGASRVIHSFVADVTRGVFRRIWPDTDSLDNAPAISPDGRTLVFRDGVNKVSTGPIDGSTPPTVAYQSSLVAHPNDWSSDGKLILFDIHTSDHFQDLMILPLDGSRKAVPYLASKADESLGQFSPDMKWIAYNSDESGRLEVYVQGFDAARLARSAGKWQISTDGGAKPRWKADGSELYYVSPKGDMMVVPLRRGAGFEPGKPQKLFETRIKAGGGFTFDVTPDGRRFLVINRIQQADTRIQILTNWFSRLGRP